MTRTNIIDAVVKEYCKRVEVFPCGAMCYPCDPYEQPTFEPNGDFFMEGDGGYWGEFLFKGFTAFVSLERLGDMPEVSIFRDGGDKEFPRIAEAVADAIYILTPEDIYRKQ